MSTKGSRYSGATSTATPKQTFKYDANERRAKFRTTGLHVDDHSIKQRAQQLAAPTVKCTGEFCGERRRNEFKFGGKHRNEKWFCDAEKVGGNGYSDVHKSVVARNVVEQMVLAQHTRRGGLRLGSRRLNKHKCAEQSMSF